jgi:hypothetical protein
MGKKFVAIIGAVAVAGVLVTTAGATGNKTFHFKDTIVGAQISSTQAAFKIHDSRLGRGAGVQTVKVSGLGGTDREVTYYGNASGTSHGSFKIGPPDANGISKLTGKGHDTAGTGKLKGFRSTYTFKGTLNTKTLVYKVVLTGTGSTK